MPSFFCPRLPCPGRSQDRGSHPNWGGGQPPSAGGLARGGGSLVHPQGRGPLGEICPAQGGVCRRPLSPVLGKDLEQPVLREEQRRAWLSRRQTRAQPHRLKLQGVQTLLLPERESRAIRTHRDQDTTGNDGNLAQRWRRTRTRPKDTPQERAVGSWFDGLIAMLAHRLSKALSSIRFRGFPVSWDATDEVQLKRLLGVAP